jgi:ABC-type transport system involved in multi-copper enzyme maturation permease subunit
MLRLLAAVLGPIFAKEMLEIARRRRYFFNRVFYGAVLLLVLFVIWEEYGWRFNYNNYRGMTAIQTMAEMASTMFQGISWVQFGAVFLFVPIFVCGVISSEREGGTLDLLLTTQLHDREIVLGKLGSRLAVMLLLIAGAIPVMSLAMLFGGISPQALWRTQAATLLAMIYAGAHAIYFSSISRSALGALVRTYWWMALWLLAMPFAVCWIAFEVFSFRTEEWVLALLALAHPGCTFAMAVHDDLYQHVLLRMGMPGLSPWLFPAMFVIPLVWSALLITRAVQRLRLPPTLLSRLTNMIAVVRNARATWGKSMARVSQRRRRAAPWTWWGAEVHNPLWLRSRLAHVYDREGHIGKIQLGSWLVAGFFLAMFILFETNGLNDEETSMGFASPAWIGVAVLTALVSASSVVGDRRRGLWELILAAPLENREFVDGTLLAIWEHLRRIYWLPICLGGFFVLTGASHPLGVICSVITATLFGAVIMELGVLCSLVSKQPAAALAPTFLFGVFMNVGTGCMIGVFEEASGPLLWAATILLLPATTMWTRVSTSVAAVSAHFLAVHLAMTCAATFWTINGRQDELPIAAMHPAFLTIVMLDGRFPTREIDRWDIGLAAIPFYWAALTANVIWARWWMIRNFDRLVGRIEPRLAPESAWPRLVSVELVPAEVVSERSTTG